MVDGRLLADSVLFFSFFLSCFFCFSPSLLLLTFETNPYTFHLISAVKATLFTAFLIN